MLVLSQPNGSSHEDNDEDVCGRERCRVSLKASRPCRMAGVRGSEEALPLPPPPPPPPEWWGMDRGQPAYDEDDADVAAPQDPPHGVPRTTHSQCMGVPAPEPELEPTPELLLPRLPSPSGLPATLPLEPAALAALAALALRYDAGDVDATLP